MLWSVVSLAGSNFEAAILRQDFDGAEAAIGNKICWLVGDGVLAAQLFLNGLKCVRHLTHLEGKEGAASGSFGDALQNLVPLTFHAADVGTDGVDDDLGALRHFDGFFARDVAEIIFAVAEKNYGAAHGASLFLLEEFVAAGEIKRVVHGGAATGSQHTNSG